MIGREATDYKEPYHYAAIVVSGFPASHVLCRERMSDFASSRENALAALVYCERLADNRLETAVCAMHDGSSDVEEVMVVGGDIRLVRRRCEEYMALLSADGVVLAYWLEIGFGRLVWTLATASATRARRALAEAGIGN